MPKGAADVNQGALFISSVAGSTQGDLLAGGGEGGFCSWAHHGKGSLQNLPRVDPITDNHTLQKFAENLPITGSADLTWVYKLYPKCHSFPSPEETRNVSIPICYLYTCGIKADGPQTHLVECALLVCNVTRPRSLTGVLLTIRFDWGHATLL